MKDWGKIRRISRKIEDKLTASRLMVGGFAAVILAGGILLTLPVCNAGGRWLNFVDALFTACSAVCVTGLVTIVPAAQFTMFGKLILLLLIQVGGFGIVVCTLGAYLIFQRKISVKRRVMLQEQFNLDTLSGLVALLKYVLCGTFVVEGIGALGYAFQFVPQFGLWRGLWYSVFHAVSAFCNAGIDILGDSSLQGYQLNPLVNAVTAGLIIMSGLGFVTWRDLLRMLSRIKRKECSVRRSLQMLRLNTKIAVVTTLVLILGGACLVFGLEYGNPDTLGNLTFGQKCMASVFQSVTTRTAGFFTIPQNLFREQSRLIFCVLMFIGGSPGGTAGGIKTTTAAVLLLHCRAILKGNEDVECFRRRIPQAVVRTAFAVLTAAFLTVILGTLLLAATEHSALMPALYEVVSAVGTVGLTAGLTPVLTTAGKWIIIILMYMGRLSPVTLAIMFAGKGGRQSGRKLPEERIMVG